MRKLIQIGYKQYVWVMLAAIVLTGALGYQITGLEIDVSSEALTAKNSPFRQAYEEVREEFGSDQIAVVYAEDSELFTAESLSYLRSINQKAAALPFVERVDSLFTLPDIRDVDGILETAPLLSSIPGNTRELQKKLEYGTENELIRDNVLSADGSATVLTLYLNPAEVASRPMRSITQDIDSILEAHRDQFDQLFQLGKPALQTWLLDALRSDQRFILPLATVILLFLLVLNQRSVIAGTIPIANGFLAVIWTLGLMSLVGLPISLLNYIIPALIVVVGATEDMHILHGVRFQVSKHGSGLKALDESAKAIGLALLLTASTTILGFAATATSSLPILQTFGLSAMIGMSVRFLISVMLLPATLALFQRAITNGAERALITPLRARRIARFLSRKVTPRLIPVLSILFLAAMMAVYFSGNIRISNDLTSFIDVDSELSRNIERSAEHLAGSKILFLTLYAQADDFRQPKHLNALDQIGDYLRSIPELDTVVSFADFIKRMNEQLRGGDPKDFTIPDSAAAIYQMLLFSRQEDFSAYVSSDYARANTIIRCNINDSTLLNQRAEQIRQALSSGRFGPHVFTLTGESLVVASAVDAIVTAQVVSLGGMAIALFVVVSCLFLSTRCGLLTVTSNLFPILLVFGLMGLTGVSLNVGTCMIAAITLGIAIDDTLHLLVRFNHELKKTKRERTAIENAVRHEMNPITSTTIALSGGFLVLALSSFAPVREFGLLSAAVLMLALGTDIIVTPMLFAHTRLITLWDLVGLKLRTQLLEQSPLFKGFSRWQAKKIILASQIEKIKAGTQVLRYHDLGSKMYVVLSGELEASIGEGDSRRSLTKIRVGDVLGEVAIVAKVRRSADVFALTDTTLLTLDAASLARLQRFSPFLASRVFLNIAAIIGARLTERIEESFKSNPS